MKPIDPRLAKIAKPKTKKSAKCGQCGYELAGIDLSGNCPECGTAIQAAIAGGELGAASKSYLQKLLRGLRLMYWSMLGYVAWSVVWLFLIFVWAGLRDPETGAVPDEMRWLNDILFEASGKLIWIAFLVPLAIGAWIMTAPDVAADDPRKVRLWRWLARIGYALLPVFSLSHIIMLMSGWPDDPFDDSLVGSQVAQAGGVLASEALEAIAIVLGGVGTFGYIAWLADRIPDEHFERWCSGLIYVYGIMALVGVMIFAIASWVAAILLLGVVARMLKHAKHLLAIKPEIEIEEYFHARPLS
jgi:hypothetical protein